MTDHMEGYKEKIAALQENGELSQETLSLLTEMLGELVEMNRSNKALRRVILKGQSSSMSTRLREALYE
ncbi:hypothetical protein A3844_16670 [Paenibacillus helianthi]|uniref:Ni2+-binding GTPase n=1 Tax=Paenibacillus helianthi TaxID=1349432 RepID=A0ABX3EM30_9BACL|nr:MULTISPECIES: hypothetical protein [Paenibacillus]OKP84230.1 hypothetical protein A3842_08335 [Paenibacillus sp. P3E]OKP85263.1 hypothetical protein A3844_16670 [Paenibacillus helianthi]OKP90084.1 hypothetical protein A3848_12025 [Paenibacillus sp. P32E]